nr:hypothetical protein [uncultured Oscillibacter sp.]
MRTEKRWSEENQAWPHQNSSPVWRGRFFADFLSGTSRSDVFFGRRTPFVKYTDLKRKNNLKKRKSDKIWGFPGKS